MSRPLRPISAGLIYHVINRGNNRQPVFFGEGDYSAFLKAIGDLKERKPFELFGYRLMSNHIHLLLRPKKVSISRLSLQQLRDPRQRPAQRTARSGSSVPRRSQWEVAVNSSDPLSPLRQ